MIAALKTELRKLFTTRLWWILTVVMAGYMLFIGAVMAFSFQASKGQLDNMGAGPVNPLDDLSIATTVYTLAVALGYVFPVLLGAMSVTSEFRHQTITPTLLSEPRRGLVLSAKMITSIPLGFLLAVVGTGSTVLGGAAVLAVMDGDPMLGDPAVLRAIALSVLALTIWAPVGVGFGSVLTNQVAAIVVLLAFTQFAEPILRLLLAQWELTEQVSKFLPGAAGEAIAGESIYASSGLASLLAPWAGTAVLLTYAVVFAIVGWLTSFRGDIK